MRRKRCAWGSSTLASWASATPGPRNSRTSSTGRRSTRRPRRRSAAATACRRRPIARRGSRSAIPRACRSPSPTFTPTLPKRSAPTAPGAPDPLALAFPSAEDGLHSLRVVHAAVESARARGGVGRRVTARSAVEPLFGPPEPVEGRPTKTKRPRLPATLQWAAARGRGRRR